MPVSAEFLVVFRMLLNSVLASDKPGTNVTYFGGLSGSGASRKLFTRVDMIVP